jgi:hypothetical protein
MMSPRRPWIPSSRREELNDLASCNLCRSQVVLDGYHPSINSSLFGTVHSE